MPKPQEAPHSIAEKFLAQSESTAVYGGKAGEVIKPLRDQTRGEIASILEHEAARLFNEERQKAEKKAKRPLQPDEVVTKGSNLEALMHLALLFKDEEGNEEITNNQQAATFKVLRGLRREFLHQNNIYGSVTPDKIEALSPEQKEYYQKLMRLQGELFTNLTGWTPKDFFDEKSVKQQLRQWKQTYEQTTWFGGRLWDMVTGEYEIKVAEEKEVLEEKEKELAEERFFEIEMVRFDNAQRSIYRGKKPLYEQGEVMESVKRDLAMERRAMYAEVLTGGKKLKKDAAKELMHDAAETADDILKDIVVEEGDIPTKNEAEFLNLFRTDGYDQQFAQFIRQRGGVNRLQGMDAASLFQFWLEWITYLVDLKNR